MKKDSVRHMNNLFRKVQLFSTLTDAELDNIRGKMQVRKFRKNKVILYEENTNKVMYVILDGKVKVIQTRGEGKEIILAIHGAGDFFGEISLIDSKTVPAVVMAMEDSVVTIISKGVFFSLLYKQSKVLDNLLQILCSRLRHSWGRIQILSCNNATQRIRMLLVQLANEHGKSTEEGIFLGIRLTHQDIADMTGVARETATRIIDKLRREGVIKVARNKFIFLTHDMLEKDAMM
jgi:CRP/FNR family cyclic AMP-dependent transcriptional regulator